MRGEENSLKTSLTLIPIHTESSGIQLYMGILIWHLYNVKCHFSNVNYSKLPYNIDITKLMSFFRAHKCQI